MNWKKKELTGKFYNSDVKMVDQSRVISNWNDPLNNESSSLSVCPWVPRCELL